MRRDTKKYGKHDVLNDWPSNVFKKANKKFYHIGMPGHGILSYYEVLQALEASGLLVDVDKLIVQLTQEPRLVCSPTPKKLQIDIDTLLLPAMQDITEEFTLNVFTAGLILNPYATHSMINHVNNGLLNSKKPTAQESLFALEMFENLNLILGYTNVYKNIFDLVYAEIKRICERNNIELYTFAWDFCASFETAETSKYEKVVTIDSDKFTIIKDKFKQRLAKEYNISYNESEEKIKEYMNDGGHYMEAGNNIANEIILEELERQGMFNV